MNGEIGDGVLVCCETRDFSTFAQILARMRGESQTRAINLHDFLLEWLVQNLKPDPSTKIADANFEYPFGISPLIIY